jgi:hypothetical protein
MAHPYNQHAQATHRQPNRVAVDLGMCLDGQSPVRESELLGIVQAFFGTTATVEPASGKDLAQFSWFRLTNIPHLTPEMRADISRAFENTQYAKDDKNTDIFAVLRSTRRPAFEVPKTRAHLEIIAALVCCAAVAAVAVLL